MKIFCFLLIALFSASRCLADEETRKIQAALSDAGFYLGTADGKMGEETRVALRRFQIRSGLDVTGTTTPETLVALKIKQGNPAASDEQEIAATAKKPDAFLAPAARNESLVEPNDAPTGKRTGELSPLQRFFVGTELAESSPTQQMDALQEAQRALLRLGYYRGDPNGLPVPELETALLRFQHAGALRVTGRLDEATRDALEETPVAVEAKPFRASKNRPPGRVFRGVWVR